MRNNGFQLWSANLLLLLLEFVLNLRRVTGMLDLGECLSLDIDFFLSLVYISLVQTLPSPNDGHLMFVGTGV